MGDLPSFILGLSTKTDNKQQGTRKETNTMATFTENYNLIKPSEEDYYDVQDFNENMDAIDGQMMETAAEVDGIGDKIGTAADEGTETVFGKLNQISDSMTGTEVQLVKSIQHVTYSPSKEASSGSCSIRTVDPQRCIVLFERLYDSSGNGTNYVSYTLNANSISIQHSSYSLSSYNNLKLGFWVVEFY